MDNHAKRLPNQPSQDPNVVSRICLVTSATALTAAACMGAVGYFFTGGMAAAGMAAVGLFYLALGLMNWQPRPVCEDVCSDFTEVTIPGTLEIDDKPTTRIKPQRKHAKPLVSVTASSKS